MNIKEVVGKKCLVKWIDGHSLDGIIEAVNGNGFTFTTQQKTAYISFEEVVEVLLLKTLEGVGFNDF